GAGSPTYALWGGPYLRAHLHRDRYGGYSQHNTLVGLGTGSNAALYAAPRFHTAAALRSLFAHGAGSTVLQNSVLAALAGVPAITDTNAHSITYPVNGSHFRLHSEPDGPFDAP